ncbi:MAG: hypothetical protein RIB61_07800 [Roseicyclus sp.]
MSGIGHNRGPSLEAGFGFRKLAWTRARAELLPALPLEIVRVRVARAKRLGLPYKTYATIRASAGQDIVAFLFSGNALDLRPGEVRLSGPVADRVMKLDGAAARLGAIYAPARAEAVLAANPGALDATDVAPAFTLPWGRIRADLRGMIRREGLPPDGVVLVSATAIERGWCGTAGLAGVVDRDLFFGAQG